MTIGILGMSLLLMLVTSINHVVEVARMSISSPAKPPLQPLSMRDEQWVLVIALDVRYLTMALLHAL